MNGRIMASKMQSDVEIQKRKAEAQAKVREAHIYDKMHNDNSGMQVQAQVDTSPSGTSRGERPKRVVSAVGMFAAAIAVVAGGFAAAMTHKKSA